MKIFRITYTAALVLLLISSCSTKKNTGASRGFHNMTSRYNILFNGTESYKKGMLSLQGAYVDDYSQRLPLYIYQDPEQLSIIAADMDRSITKAMKVISMHSITVKPEIKDGEELSEKDREFYAKNEFNKWVDDAYLLMAKANFYKKEYIKASQTLNYLLANFSDEPTIYETKIWLARLALEKKRFKEAEEYLDDLTEDQEFPQTLLSELHATLAEKALLENNKQEAVNALKLAVEETRSKYYRQRHTFILAQLSQEMSLGAEATNYYKAVIKLDPPYEMTFNARINMALSYESGSVKVIEKELDKMLRDDKNIEFQDQIYYAWGNLYYKSGDVEKALEYYVLAAAKSSGNTIQLARTYLTIADIYYNKPAYELAQVYYDSTVSIIDVGYPNYPVIFAKSISLTNLVTHIQTVELQDSVQKLRSMPQAELYAYIDEIIEADRVAEEERRLKEQEALLKDNSKTQQEFELSSTAASNWYFYNPTSLNLGKQEFKKTWGARKLEDDWRRSNKSTVTYDAISSEESEESLTENGEIEDKESKAGGKYSRETYLKNIPFTDSALKASHEKIKIALSGLGDIYSNELKDYDKAEEAYLSLLSRYPSYSDKLMVYYRLYNIGKITEDDSMLAVYKQKIISEFPNSDYAKVLSDPEYFKKVEEEEKKIYITYNQVYDNFNKGQFSQVVSPSRKVIEVSPEHELVPQFDYMLTISEGKFKDTASFIGDLQRLISRYPGTEIADNSTLLIKYLQDVSPEAAIEHVVKQAVQVYKINQKEPHLVVLSVKKAANSNQMMFNIINYNLDNFDERELKVRKYNLEGTSLLSVVSFKDGAEAKEYYESLEANPEIWKDVDKGGSNIFIISRSNYSILKKEKKLDQYMAFFRDKY